MFKNALILFFCLSLLPISVWSREPYILNPDSHENLVASMGLGDPNDSRFINTLIVAFDEPLSKKSKKLSSRTDIMMVLSMDKLTRDITIYSYGRDMEPSPGCASRIGRSRKKGDNKLLNAVYLIYGRAAFISCLDSLTPDLVRKSGIQSEYDFSNGFPIHFVYEVKRTGTLRPFAGSVKNVAKSNFLTFLGIYFQGVDQLIEIADTALNSRKLLIKLKSRKYGAGSYQRAFNNARFIADALAWASVGVQAYDEEGYDFVSRFFADSIDSTMGRAQDAVEFDQAMTLYNSQGRGVDHMLRYAGYTNGLSPVRIVQFGHTSNSAVVYENGQLNKSAARDYFLKRLKDIPIMPIAPDCPDCHIIPSSDGHWGQSPLN